MNEQNTSSDQQEQLNALDAQGLSGLNSLEALKSKITTFLKWSIEQNHIVKYSTLARKYSVVASRINVPIREVFREMVTEGKIRVITGPTGNIYLTDPEFWTETFEPLLESKEPAERTKALDHIIDHAW